MCLRQALGESSQHPTVGLVQAIGGTINRMRGLTAMATDGLELNFVKAERQLATFASQDYKERFRRPEYHAQDVLAQALWYVTSRAVRHKMAEVCAASVEVIVPLLAEDVDLGQTARMNAAYTAVSLGQQKEFASPASKAALSDALDRASNDDDRCKCSGLVALHILVVMHSHGSAFMCSFLRQYVST